MGSQKQHMSRVNLIIAAFFVPVCLIALLPVWTLIVSSFASKQSLAEGGFQIWPSGFSLDAYRYILVQPGFVVRAYGITVMVSVVGTFFSLWFSSMYAYAICRPQLRIRKAMGFYIFFTILFSGGTLPYYLLVTRFLHLKNNLLILILPTMVAPFNVLLLRSFFQSLPASLIESAKLDGAGEFRIYLRIMLPLSTSALATVGLFSFLGYWNDMYQALLFIDKQQLYPMQYLLYKLTYNTSVIPQDGASYTGIVSSPLSLRMALATLALVPVMFSFAFVQKYFVRGITLGSIKGD